MGKWGAKLYDNDVAYDVKGIYKDMLSVGIVEEKIINHLVDYFSAPDELIILWPALADMQWKYGRLQETVKDNALECIDIEIKQLKDDIYSRQRRKELLKLKEKLNSPQPELKKVSKLKCWKSPFKTGDLLLFKINESSYKSDYVNNHKWLNKYVLFRVMALGKSNVGFLPQDEYFHDTVIIGLYNWVGESCGPNDVSQLDFYEQEKTNYNFDTLTNEVYHDARFCVLLSETRKTLQRFNLLTHDYKYVKKDVINKKNIPSFDLQRIETEHLDISFHYSLMCSFYNGDIIDYELLVALDRMEEQKILNIE